MADRLRVTVRTEPPDTEEIDEPLDDEVEDDDLEELEEDQDDD